MYIFLSLADNIVYSDDLFLLGRYIMFQIFQSIVFPYV